MQDLISIIVPIYNVEHYLKECLDSIIYQSHKNLEIILVDDGSTDNSGEICDCYKENDSRIKVFHTSNKGLSAARNLGMLHATGSYIGFVDSDDVISGDMYQILYGVTQDYNAQIAECRCIRGYRIEEKSFSNRNEKVYCYTGKEAAERNLRPDLRSRRPGEGVYTKLYKREIISDLWFPEGRIHEDYLFICRALMRCANYCLFDGTLYLYRIREGSITQASFNMKDMDRLTTVKERTNFLQKSGEWKLAKLSKAYEYSLYFIYYYQAKKSGMKAADYFADKIRKNKFSIIKSDISFKRKIIYMLFFIDPSLYIFAMNLIKKSVKR